MLLRSTDIARLALVVQRLLDAEILPAEDGAALLAEAEASLHSLEEEDAEAARRHVERLALLADALIGDGSLDPAAGRAVVATARTILTGNDR